MRARQLPLTIILLFALISSCLLGRIETVRAELKVSGGENHTIVLAENRFVWICGPNGNPDEQYHGVLGTGSDSETLIEKTLTQVWRDPTGTSYLVDITEIAAGWMHSLALDIHGFVRS